MSRWICVLVGVLAIGWPKAATAEAVTTAESEVGGCFPECRSGYVCHPETRECVSICNPPCEAWEVCTADAECVAEREGPSGPLPELGDTRFRFVVLGRFGFGGKLRGTFVDVFGDETKAKRKPDRATLGFDLRFEKPILKFLSVGGVVGNYFIRNSVSANWALDLSPFVKPRFVFRVGKYEGEFYGVIQLGGSLALLEVVDLPSFAPQRELYGGFNAAISPGFQVFFSRAAAFVIEVGYSFSWLTNSGQSLRKLSIGQATVRTGFSFAF